MQFLRWLTNDNASNYSNLNDSLSCPSSNGGYQIMGYNTALDLSNELDLEMAISIHLQSNHYPPVPLSMVEPCIQAIDFAHDDMWDETVVMPDGITYKGETCAPVWAIIEQHHLHAWLPEEDY